MRKSLSVIRLFSNNMQWTLLMSVQRIYIMLLCFMYYVHIFITLMITVYRRLTTSELHCSLNRMSLTDIVKNM